MEPTRRKFGIGAVGIVGLIFTTVGAFFGIIGMILGFRGFLSTGVEREILWILPVVFIGIGVVFFALGLIFIIITVRKRQRQKMAVERGQLIYADVSAVGINTSISVNGRSPYYVECHYKDPVTGTLHVFRSRDLYFDPASVLGQGMMIPVYVMPGDFDSYYVDVDAVLPRVEQH